MISPSPQRALEGRVHEGSGKTLRYQTEVRKGCEETKVVSTNTCVAFLSLKVEITLFLAESAQQSQLKQRETELGRLGVANR